MTNDHDFYIVMLEFKACHTVTCLHRLTLLENLKVIQIKIVLLLISKQD